MSQHHKINGNFSSRSICYGMIMRAPQKNNWSKRVQVSRLETQLKSKHSPRVEFIEHLKLMNLNGLDKRIDQLMGTFTEAEEEKRKSIYDGGSIITREPLIKFYSIDQFHLCAVRKKAVCELKTSHLWISCYARWNRLLNTRVSGMVSLRLMINPRYFRYL